MKRRDLIGRISAAARVRSLTWELRRQGAKDEIWAIGGREIAIPRHREISELTAKAIPAPAGSGVRQAMVVKPTYTATAQRVGTWWSIRVQELPGVFSQARRLDRVESMARDAIALLLQVPHDSFDVTVTQALDAGTRRAIEVALAAREGLAAQQKIAATTSRAAAMALHRQGLPQRDIGRLLKLSHQRVAQLLGSEDAGRP